MASLYELTGEYLELLEMLEDPECDAEAVKAAMEALDGSLESKFEGYMRVMRNVEGELLAIDTEIKRLQEKKKARTAAVDRIRDQIMTSMEATGKTKIKGSLFSATLSTRKNGTLVIDDEDEIPDQFWAVKKEVKRGELKKFLLTTPSCEYAHLEDSKTLRLS